MRTLKLLPYKDGEVGTEVRKFYFYKAWGKDVGDFRVISFGACNFSCPYCTRMEASRNPEGSVLDSIEVPFSRVLEICEDAITKNQVVRLSGGDPVIYPRESMEIAQYVHDKGKKISIAHNGSSPQFISRISPFLESAAIDLKGPRHNIALITGLKESIGRHMYDRSLVTQNLLAESGIYVDVRTPIFGWTTLDDLLLIADDITRGKNSWFKFWTLRLYRKVNWCDFPAPDKENVIWMAHEVKKRYPELKMGIRAQWEPTGFLYL